MAPSALWYFNFKRIPDIIIEIFAMTHSSTESTLQCMWVLTKCHCYVLPSFEMDFEYQKHFIPTTKHSTFKSNSIIIQINTYFFIIRSVKQPTDSTTRPWPLPRASHWDTTTIGSCLASRRREQSYQHEKVFRNVGHSRYALTLKLCLKLWFFLTVDVYRDIFKLKVSIPVLWVLTNLHRTEGWAI